MVFHGLWMFSGHDNCSWTDSWSDPSSFFLRDSSMAFMKLFQLSPLHVDTAFKKAPVHALPDLVPEEGSLSSLANGWVVHVNPLWIKSSLTWKCMLCLLIKGRHDLLMMKMQERWEKVLWWWHKWNDVRQVDRFVQRASREIAPSSTGYFSYLFTLNLAMLESVHWLIGCF
jgi:hypothetical protein